jgi:transposase-like protein
VLCPELALSLLLHAFNTAMNASCGRRHEKEPIKQAAAGRKLMEHFLAGTTARTAAGLVRELIYQAIEDATPFAGEIEVDESYFGGRRKKTNVGGVRRARCRSLAC